MARPEPLQTSRSNDMIRKSLYALVTLVALLALVHPIATAQSATTQHIHGAWLMQVTAVNCNTGAALGTFSSVYTFSEGGTLTNITNGASAAARSAGLGSWTKTGSHSVKGMSLAFLFGATNVWTGTQKITIAVDTQDDAQRLTGVINVEIFNTSAALIATSCATTVGQRLVP
jgi:hypothetical protein